MYGPYWNYWSDAPGPWHMMGWGWGFGWIFPLLMMALFIGVCVYAFTRMSGHGGARDRGALDILAQRYARGEIGKEEFEEKRTLLSRRP